MSDPPKHALITHFISRTRDRYHEYNLEKSFPERLAVVSRIPGFTGVEIGYPYEVPDPKECTALLQKYGLQAAAINVNVKTEPEFRNGGLTCTDPAVRSKAVRFIREAKEYARAVGADKVTCCPLGDGYEFSFNCDYRERWRYLVESLGEVAEYLPEIPLFVEYKPSETRGRCFVDTAAKTLCLLNDIGVDAMGVTLDYGHAKFAQENPAEALSLVARSRFRCYVHINDNNARWDWDFMVGSHDYLQYVEFLFYLQEIGYSDFLTSDTSPTRWDIAETFQANSRMTTKIWRRLNEIDREAFLGLIRGDDFTATWRFVEARILGLG